jgi:hypothetical protein
VGFTARGGSSPLERMRRALGKARHPRGFSFPGPSLTSRTERQRPSASTLRGVAGRLVSICPPSRQDPHDTYEPGLCIPLKAHTPVANTQPPFFGTYQLDDISSWRIARESIEREDDTALHRPIKALEVPGRPSRKDPAAAVAQATSRLISSAETTSPRAICP